MENNIVNQLIFHDPSLKSAKKKIAALINDPDEVEKIIKKQRQAGVNRKIQNAIENVSDKLEDVNKLERNIQALCEMVEELSLIVKA